MDECRGWPTSRFGAMVRQTASRLGVEPRALAVRTLLHLPRIASRAGWMRRRDVDRELSFNAERLRRDVGAAKRYVAADSFLLRQLSFEFIDSTTAEPVFTLLHYLGSARPGALNFALVDPAQRLPVTLCSVSPLEWKRVAGQIHLQFGISATDMWDVSRVYSTDIAPRNAISLLLANVRNYIRRNVASKALLVTAVDPNLGFTGSSYRAANWQQWMAIQARPYIYERKRYASPRQLRRRFGTLKLTELQSKYPGVFEQSRVHLLDSMIFCCRVAGPTQSVPPQDRRRLHR
jgi:hypothetical protein